MKIYNCCYIDDLINFKTSINDETDFNLCLKIAVDNNSINICKFIIENNHASKNIVYDVYQLITTSCMWNKDKTFEYLFGLDKHSIFDIQQYFNKNIETLMIGNDKNYNILFFLLNNGAIVEKSVIEQAKNWNNNDLVNFLSTNLN